MWSFPQMTQLFSLLLDNTAFLLGARDSQEIFTTYEHTAGLILGFNIKQTNFLNQQNGGENSTETTAWHKLWTCAYSWNSSIRHKRRKSPQTKPNKAAISL